jgi:hypothetical protein
MTAREQQLLDRVVEAAEEFVLTAEAEGQVSAAEAGFVLVAFVVVDAGYLVFVGRGARPAG